MEIQYVKAFAGAEVEIPAPGAHAMVMVSIGAESSALPTRPDATVWVVLRGTVNVSCPQGEATLSSGEWIQLEAQDCPVVRCGRRGLIVGVVMGHLLHARQANSLHGALLPGFGRAERGQLRALLRQWRLTMRGAPQQKPGLHPLTAAWQAKQLLQCMAGLQYPYEEFVGRCPGRSLRRRRLVFGRLQRAFIHQRLHLDSPMSVTAMAERACMSLSYFIRTCSAVYGNCPQAMARAMRLERAAGLLRDSSLSIAEVGSQSGFQNNCSFSRVFRSRYGISPSRYRQQGEQRGAIKANVRVNEGQSHLRCSLQVRSMTGTPVIRTEARHGHG